MAIVSEAITYKNSQGEYIVGIYDYLDGNEDTCQPFIIILPTCGKIEGDAKTLAHYLAKNGLHVIRYDNANKIDKGDESDFSTISEDLSATLDFAERRFGVGQFGILTQNLNGTAEDIIVDSRIKLRGFLTG